MDCPSCTTDMSNATESWHTFDEARGAEYLASYVTIWHCPACQTVVGAHDDQVEWTMEQEAVLQEDELPAPRLAR